MLETIEGVAGRVCPNCGKVILKDTPIALNTNRQWEHSHCPRQARLKIVRSNPNPERTWAKAQLTLV